MSYQSGDSRARFAITGDGVSTYYFSVYWKLPDSDSWTRYDSPALTQPTFAYADVTTTTLGVPSDSTVHFAFGQMELGSFPTSYIPTTTAAVTRAADLASITGTNFSSWYNQSEGTVFANVSSAGSAGVVGFDDGGFAERFRIGFAGSNNAAAVVVDGGVVQTNINTPGNSTPYNQYHKLCNAISENNLSFSYNGSLVQDNSLSVPSVNTMTIGSAIGFSDRVNGHISQLSYYPTRLSDEELVTLTS